MGQVNGGNQEMIQYLCHFEGVNGSAEGLAEECIWNSLDFTT